MGKKTLILIPIIVLLIALSGCIHLITTAERQACLSATHTSTNSIINCKTQNECYNKLTAEIIISNKLPLEIYNNNIIYFNNIASATNYFNKSKENINKINDACNVEDADSLINSANDLFYYFRNIFTYVDKANKTSIILLKDYAIYLDSQGINKIPEEDLYLDFVIINENINELKVSSNNKNYVSNLLEKSKQLNEIAKEFGFRKDYISNVNYIDLSAYYLKLIEDPSGNIKVPTIGPGLNYVISELSNIEQLKTITKNLKKADNYNFYILMDKSIGTNNSVYFEFKEINKNTNKNINKTYEKIEELEAKIKVNPEYISQINQIKINKDKQDFQNKKIGFGDYLYALKEINLEIEKNKLMENDKNTEIYIKLKMCAEIINRAKEINNNYLNELITRYENTDNYLVKQNYCDKISYEINTNTCKSDLLNVLENKIEEINQLNIMLIESDDEKECVRKINNINQVLENNEKIKLIKEILKENENIIIEIKAHNKYLEYEDKIKLENITSETTKVTKESNYKLIIDIDKKIELQKQNYEGLIELCKIIQEKYILESHNIELINNTHYLIVTNYFSKTLDNIKISLQGIEKINDVVLLPGKNYIKINFENTREVTKKIIKLKLEDTLFEININNRVEGITDKEYLGKEIILVSGAEMDENGYAWYVSKTSNKILFYQDILDNTVANTNIIDIGAGKYKFIEEINVKNIYEKGIDEKIELTDIGDEEIKLVKENNKEIDAQKNNGKLIINLNLKVNEGKVYQIHTIKEKTDVIEIAKENKMYSKQLIDSRFIDVSNLAKKHLQTVAIAEINEELTIESLCEILGYTNKINEIKEKEAKNTLLEDEFNLIYTKLINNEDINTEIKLEIQEIDNEKYENISNSLNKINIIKNKINKEIYEKQQTQKSEDIEKIKYLKEKAHSYDLAKTDLITEIDNLTIDNNPGQIAIVEEKLNIEIKNKAESIYGTIKKIQEINLRDIEKLIEIGNNLFFDFDLQEIYAKGYFPVICPPDIARLDKKYKFLETITLNEEINEFIEKYDTKKYEDAINSISQNTISRMEDIINEQKLVEEGLSKIKEDAKNKLNTYIEENKNTKNTNIKETISVAKEYYDQEKYLNTIALIENHISPQKNKTQTQIILVSVITLIFLFISYYFRFGKKKHKEINNTERKKHIIKHN